MFVGRQEILGADEILGVEEILGADEILGLEEILGADEILGASPVENVIKGAAGITKRAVTLPIDVAEWALSTSTKPARKMFVGREEILGADDLGAFVGSDERALALEGDAERSALARRGASCGYNSHLAYVQGATPSLTADDLAKLQSLAQNGNKRAKRLIAKIARAVGHQDRPKSTSSGATSSQEGRLKAKEILSRAAGAKKISRADLKQAIWLYAGSSSTEKERTAIGRKMIDFLNQRKVVLA
jgi:hypothetical protein